MVDSYDRSTRTLDDGLGVFLRALRERGLLENSVLVISVDHGENTVGHGGLFEHKELRARIVAERPEAVQALQERALAIESHALAARRAAPPSARGFQPGAHMRDTLRSLGYGGGTGGGVR